MLVNTDHLPQDQHEHQFAQVHGMITAPNRIAIMCGDAQGGNALGRAGRRHVPGPAGV
jgi:hypothetical protein